MKSKEEILNSYYSQGKDGLPEISADDLLKAMEAYSEQAFNAARNQRENDFTYPTYQDYLASLAVKPAEPAEADNIRFIADSIMEQFIPHDPKVNQFSFDFKTSGNNYTVRYLKSPQGYWVFENYNLS